MALQFTSRNQLLANLAGQRANFLNAIFGLTTDQLNQPLWDDWSSRSLLPHIALWDAREADRLHKIAAGQSGHIANIDVDAQNAAWHAQHKATSVDAGMAMLLKERNGLINAVAAVSDEQWVATFKTQHHDAFSPLYCTNNSIEHDEDHANDVTKWRNATDQEALQLGPKSVLVALLRAGLHDFEATAAAVAETVAADTAICGHWNLKQLVAHMASWETHAAATLENMVAAPVAQTDAEIDAENELWVNERLHLPIADLWQEYRSGRQRMIELVNNMSDEQLGAKIADCWADEDLAYYWGSYWVSHDMEHAKELRGLYCKKLEG